MKEQKIFIFLLIKGLVWLIAGIVWLLSRRAALKTWPRTEAQIERAYYDQDGLWVAAFGYTIVSGERITAVTSASDGIRMGSHVEIAYNPQDPSSLVIVTRGGNSLWPHGCIAVGVILISLAFWISAG